VFSQNTSKHAKTVRVQSWCSARAECTTVYGVLTSSARAVSQKAGIGALVSAKGHGVVVMEVTIPRTTPSLAPIALLRSISCRAGPLLSVAIDCVPHLHGFTAPEFLAAAAIGAVFPDLVDSRFSVYLSHIPRDPVDLVRPILYFSSVCLYIVLWPCLGPTLGTFVIPERLPRCSTNVSLIGQALSRRLPVVRPSATSICKSCFKRTLESQALVKKRHSNRCSGRASNGNAFAGQYCLLLPHLLTQQPKCTQEHTPFAGIRAQADADRSPNSVTRALTAEELEKHPEFPYLTWNLSPTSKGHVAVAATRGGPIKVAYEIHGHGPIHLVVRRNCLSANSDRKSTLCVLHKLSLVT
jgi:hypothetical protein